jgi:glycosyltransferase involved in cell wall biosynthesis
VRLAFDVTPLSVPRTGIGNVVRGMLSGAIAQRGAADEIVAAAMTDGVGAGYVRESLRGFDVDLRIAVVPVANVARRAWGAARVPGVERLIGRVDGLHVTDWWHPPQRAGVRATTIHDLVPLRFPQWTTARVRAAHRLGYRHATRSCDLVFVNSHGTAADVRSVLGIPSSRIHVAPPGVDPRFTRDGERADIGARYVLAVGTLEPRKNLAAAIAAHGLLEDDDVLLVVAGGQGWGSVAVVGERVRWTGYVDDDELARLYRGASAFVFPSFFEGFGMPVVEAMASGVPVVASSDPSLDEACGDAAIRVRPDRPEDIAAGLTDALSGRPDLVERGLAHSATFTWERVGRVVLDAFREARAT